MPQMSQKPPLTPIQEDFQNLEYVSLEEEPTNHAIEAENSKIQTQTNSSQEPAQILVNGFIYPDLTAAPPPYPFGVIPDPANMDSNMQQLSQNTAPISHVVILPCQCNGPCGGSSLYHVISSLELQHRRRMAYITVLIFFFVAIACIVFFFKVHATIEQSYEEAVKSLDKNWPNK